MTKRLLNPGRKGPPIVPLKVRFERYFTPGSQQDCWQWTGTLDRCGYGIISNHVGVKPMKVSAHRVSWEIFRGAIPSGMCVCHTCDNPWCVNPDHLFLGTHLENMQDMIKKGRHGPRLHPEKIIRGTFHHMSKMTNEQVADIKWKIKSGLTLSSLARAYNVSKEAISQIKHGRAWKHVLARTDSVGPLQPQS